MSRLLTVALFVASALGCQPEPAPPTWPGARLPDSGGANWWRGRRAAFRELEQRFGRNGAYTMNVTLEIEQPLMAGRMRARGAIAVAPPNALRMILLGPGGTTALDLWVCGDQFRFEVPALDLARRGDDRTPRAELRGLPVDFLRWWLLDPFGGQLLTVQKAPDGYHRYYRRSDERVARFDYAGGDLSAARGLANEREEVLAEPGACAVVRYSRRAIGLEVEVRCEKIVSTTPPARAFADPDDASVACAALRGGVSR